MKPCVAIFDFDGTISHKDSFLEFIRFSNGSARLILCHVIHLPFILLTKLNLYPNWRLKERYFSFFFKGENEKDVLTKGKEFSQTILPSIIYKEALEILDWHKKRKDDIIILTASSSVWLKEWCEANQFELIGTNFETKNNRFSGKIDGKNCYGTEKVQRIKPKLSIYNDSFGYGDSKSDLPFLRFTKHPFNFSLDTNGKKKWSEYLKTIY